MRQGCPSSSSCLTSSWTAWPARSPRPARPRCKWLQGGLPYQQPGREFTLSMLLRVAKKWGMAVNYPRGRGGRVVALPAATVPPLVHQRGSQATYRPQYVGSIVLADGGQDMELQRRLCSAGQVFSSLKATFFSSRRVRLGSKLKSTSPWCCPGSCTVQRSDGPSEAQVLNRRPSTLPA